jgi:hypothetical protein
MSPLTLLSLVLLSTCTQLMKPNRKLINCKIQRFSFKANFERGTIFGKSVLSHLTFILLKGNDQEIEFHEIVIGIFQLFAKLIGRLKRP